MGFRVLASETRICSTGRFTIVGFIFDLRNPNPKALRTHVLRLLGPKTILYRVGAILGLRVKVALYKKPVWRFRGLRFTLTPNNLPF